MDRCSNGGELLLYYKDDISSRLLTVHRLPHNVECLFTEINIRNKKWLLCCSYNPHRNNILSHISDLSKGLDNYISHYDNILFLGDFNSQPSENYVNDFCNVYNLLNFVKEPTCYKNPDNPSCIDLFLTNSPKCFQSIMTMETGISDFHKMIITVLNIFYKKQKPKIIHCRNYKTFNANLFKEEMNNELLNTDIDNAELVEFTSTVLSVLDKHAPIRGKYIHANNSVFMTKELRAAIMQRSKLRQKFLEERTNDSKHLYNRQRNLCVSLQRKTRDYFKQLNNTVTSDNKKFRLTISPLFLEKGFRKETIILKDSNRTITNNHELAETFNTFFSNITQNLKLDSNLVEITENLNISDAVIKAIKNYVKHPSVIKVKEKMKNKNMFFSFSFVTKEIILNELCKLNPKKAYQESDIPVKIIKENLDIVSNFVYNNFNNFLFSSNFPSYLKNATISPIFKQKDRDS